MINKIFFLGTPAFSANILQGLIEKGINVAGVITGTDKKQDRGHAISQSEVALVAEINKIPLFKPNNIIELKEILQKEAPNLCLVIAFGMIFPADLVETYDFINIHTSLLPKYRGPSPVQSCLLNGNKTTGVTLMKIGKGIDDGDIIHVEQITISEEETTESLFNKLEKLSINLLAKQLSQKELWTYLPQNNKEASFTKKIKKEDGCIDFTKETAKTIYNKFQAYYPWPGIYTYQNDQRIKITNLKISNNTLEIVTIQKEGKRPVAYKDFLNSNPPLI
ncbi:MAG: methionyl-tRNA formyltransferase [Candidatus Riflemargulisbacteria bacterium]